MLRNMCLLGNIIISFMTFYTVARGNMIFDTFAVKYQGVVTPSLGNSLLCGRECNGNINCAGFFIGDEGTCQLLEHGQAPISFSTEGAYFQKLPEQMPTLYTSDKPVEAPRNCLDVKIREGSLTSGETHSIDPDGAGGEDPISVTCQTDDNLTFRTVIGHNRDRWNSWSGPLPDKIAPQSNRLDITYNANHAQIHTLAVNSMACSMYVYFKCQYVDFNSFRWVGYNGSWYPLNVGTTHCPADQGRTCNCAAGRNAWADDRGEFTDKSQFPVTAVLSGGFESWSNIFEIPELHPVQCQETPTCTKPPTVLFATRDKTEQVTEAGFAHGDQVVYTCFSGLRFPDDETTVTLTCQNKQMWSGMMYTECGE